LYRKVCKYFLGKDGGLGDGSAGRCSPEFGVESKSIQGSRVDTLVKSLKMLISVIPAPAGIQEFQSHRKTLDTGRNLSRFSGTGVTTFYEVVKSSKLKVQGRYRNRMSSDFEGRGSPL
jgi:hypothetical protein